MNADDRNRTIPNKPKVWWKGNFPERLTPIHTFCNLLHSMTSIIFHFLLKIIDFLTLFRKWTKNRSLTKKRFGNIKSLNGIYQWISSTPRFFNPFMMESQNLALSFSPTYIPSTSFLPFRLIPRAMYTARFTIRPSLRTW